VLTHLTRRLNQARLLQARLLHEYTVYSCRWHGANSCQQPHAHWQLPPAYMRQDPSILITANGSRCKLLLSKHTGFGLSTRHVRLALRQSALRGAISCLLVVQPSDALAAQPAARHLVEGLRTPAQPVRNSPAAHQHKAAPQHQHTAC
jgi:hypothetical protein